MKFIYKSMYQLLSIISPVLPEFKVAYNNCNSYCILVFVYTNSCSNLFSNFSITANI